MGPSVSPRGTFIQKVFLQWKPKSTWHLNAILKRLIIIVLFVWGSNDVPQTMKPLSRYNLNSQAHFIMGFYHSGQSNQKNWFCWNACCYFHLRIQLELDLTASLYSNCLADKYKLQSKPLPLSCGLWASSPSPGSLLETKTLGPSLQIDWSQKCTLTRSSVYTYIQVWETLL